jgi:hypothetical protein
MSESLHADLLAQWLSAAPGSAPPEGLEEEVLGSIYALAPDRAPPHRVRIDDVLDALLTGPLADPEVSEAAIALNPDLAPEHRVDIDQILDSVTEGPFAATAQPGGKIIDLDAARRRRRWWVGTGAIAAAAVALFIVVPISHKAEEAPAEMSTKKAKPERASSAPSAKQARKAKRAKRAKPEARMRLAEERPPVETRPVAVRKDKSKRDAVGSTAGSGSFGVGGLAGLTEPDASPAPSAPFPPGMGRMDSRAQSISAGSAPAMEKKSRDQPPRPADQDDAEALAEYEDDAESVEIPAESAASADIAPEKAKQRKKEAKPKKSMP